MRRARASGSVGVREGVATDDRPSGKERKQPPFEKGEEKEGGAAGGNGEGREKEEGFFSFGLFFPSCL